MSDMNGNSRNGFVSLHAGGKTGTAIEGKVYEQKIIWSAGQSREKRSAVICGVAHENRFKKSPWIGREKAE